jgi:alkanesulfonate monooxygenase SsuD/methylene tetrahydromethanopterin reductase-like flavin-dependent oxidoreductase (luciferase family)
VGIGGAKKNQMSQPVALYLQDAHTIAEGREFVRYAEAKGFDAVWQAESRLVRDAVVPMAAFATVTDTIKVGSGVADCWSRNPARLAATFASLDDLAPGRIILGLGAWWDPLAAKVGIERRKPLTVMREVVTVCRALLANETVINRIESELEHANRLRRLSQNLFTPSDTGGFEFIVRHNRVHDTHFICALGTVFGTQEENFTSKLLANLTCQISRAITGVERGDIGVGLLELGVLGTGD